jgi:hypothetical protein
MQSVRNEPRGQARITSDVSEATRRTVVVTHEIQVRAVSTDHAVRACAKATTVTRDRRSEHAKRGAISRGQDYGLEWLFGTVDEPHALWRELLQASAQLNASGPDAVRQMEPDEGHSSAGVFGWRWQRRGAAKPICNRARDPHRSTKHRRRKRVEYGTDVLDRDAKQLSRHDPSTRPNCHRHVCAGVGEFRADFSGRIPRAHDKDTLIRERLGTSILDAVDDSAFESLFMWDLRRIGIRDDPGRDDDDARPHGHAAPQPNDPVFIVASHRFDVRPGLNRQVEAPGVESEVVDKVLA